MRTFETWTYEEVEDAFALVQCETSPTFENWLIIDKDPNFSINEREKENLDALKKTLVKEVINWNEDELKLFFIGPLLALVNFSTPHFKAFTQRTLTIQTPSVSASGKVDFLLAKGKVTPKLPYFCLHEYKQENRRDNDPLGQLLIGMVAAQFKNQPPLPIYGAYVSGRNWFFVLLEDKNYYLSNAFNASNDDIYKIYLILKKMKTLIEQHAK